MSSSYSIGCSQCGDVMAEIYTCSDCGCQVCIDCACLDEWDEAYCEECWNQ